MSQEEEPHASMRLDCTARTGRGFVCQTRWIVANQPTICPVFCRRGSGAQNKGNKREGPRTVCFSRNSSSLSRPCFTKTFLLNEGQLLPKRAVHVTFISCFWKGADVAIDSAFMSTAVWEEKRSPGARPASDLDLEPRRAAEVLRHCSCCLQLRKGTRPHLGAQRDP